MKVWTEKILNITFWKGDIHKLLMSTLRTLNLSHDFEQSGLSFSLINAFALMWTFTWSIILRYTLMNRPRNWVCVCTCVHKRNSCMFKVFWMQKNGAIARNLTLVPHYWGIITSMGEKVKEWDVFIEGVSEISDSPWGMYTAVLVTQQWSWWQRPTLSFVTCSSDFKH